MINHLSRAWLISITALFATTPPALVLWFQDLLLPYLEKGSPVVVLRLIATLLLTTTALLAYAFILRRPKKYIFYPELGLKGDIEKGLLFCPKCQTPMRIERDHFFCIACQNSVALPDVPTAEMVWKVTQQKQIRL